MTRATATKRAWMAVVLCLVTMVGHPMADQAAALEWIDVGVERVMEDWGAPGAAVVVIDDGIVVHSAGYGFADLERRTRVNVDRTAFRLASLSKPITAMALMKLHEAGRLDLRAPVDDYLSRLNIETGGQLHVVHLLTHTGGFEDRFLNRLTRDSGELPELGAYLTDELPVQRYAPGDVSLYSNHGMALAGLVASEIHGGTFGDAMDYLVFSPLRLKSTSFDPGAVGDRLAQGYRDGEAVAVHGIKTVPSSMIVSSAADMTRLMLALMDPEASGWLAQTTVDLMLRRHFEHHPSFTGRALGLSEDSSVSPRRLLHSGGTDGFSAALVLVPERRGGIFVVLNSNAYVWDLVREILREVFPAVPLAAGEMTRARETVPAPLSAGRFVPAEVPDSSLDRPRLLFEQTVVAPAGDQALRFRGLTYRRVDDGEYRSEEGRTIVVRRGQQGEVFLLEEGAAWVRLPWYDGAPLHLAATVLFLFAHGWLLSSRRLGQGLVRGALVSRLLRVAAAWNLLYLLGVGAVFGVAMANDGGSLRFGVPWYLTLLLALPLGALALSAVAAGVSVAGGRAREGETNGRWRIPAALVCLFSFGLFLAYWNQLGWNL